MSENKIAIIIDGDFASKHDPPFPKPSFISFENPLRMANILSLIEQKQLFNHDRILKLEPKQITDSILELAHSKYHIDSIKRIARIGGGLIDDEVFITEDSFNLAVKAVGGAIEAIEGIIDGRFNQSFALIRPPGHHALRESASGLCLFNNIANAILYMRKERNYKKKIAIVDIDNHFGDGLARYFYEDPSVLYFSIHEFDFTEGDLGMIDELGSEEGLGRNVNFPIPSGSTNEDFKECYELVELMLSKFEPDLIIVAAGFDMYFADPIGNCCLTSTAYHEFTKKLMNSAYNLCEGRISFILEGGYSVIGLPYCIYSVIKGFLEEEYIPPEFEQSVSRRSSRNKEEIVKIKQILLKLLRPYWNL